MAEISRSTQHNDDTQRYVVGTMCADEHESPSNFSLDAIFSASESLVLIGSVIRRTCPFEFRRLGRLLDHSLQSLRGSSAGDKPL